jgi:hypothetical protein
MQPLEELHIVHYAVPRLLAEIINFLRDLLLLRSLTARL